MAQSSAPPSALAASSPIDRLSPEQLPLVIRAGAVVIDIRSQSARSSQGVLSGALAVDQFVLAARCEPGGEESLCRAADAGAWWVLVSANGVTSLHAARRLRAAGLARVSDVVGGFTALRVARGALSAAGARHAGRERETLAVHF